MPYRLNVYALPKFVAPEDLASGTVVVLDVLRASTTIACALQSGAREVIPCLEVDEARAVPESMPGGDVILGGERSGLPIAGFDLGNSPAQYTPSRVGGKTVVLTTTNGTRAMLYARQAERILIGAFVNAAAIVERLLGQEQIHLLCAGTEGQISYDDVLAAGLLVDRIERNGGLAYEKNAQAVTAREHWLHSFALPHAVGAEPLEPGRLTQELRKTLGAKHLIELGLDADIEAAAQLDSIAIVPELDTVTLRIRPAE